MELNRDKARPLIILSPTIGEGEAGGGCPDVVPFHLDLSPRGEEVRGFKEGD